MKVFKYLVCTLVIACLISCKKEKEAETVVEKNEVDVVTITLNAVVKSDDNFQVFFKEDNNPAAPYQEENSVWCDVKGSETAQDIVFKLPEGVFPAQIRMDLGIKPQSEIVVNKFEVKYQAKSFEAKGAQFFDYFTPDENFVKFDKAALKILPVREEGKAYDPMIFSNSQLDAELVKIIQ